jgi:hypothetical protein
VAEQLLASQQGLGSMELQVPKRMKVTAVNNLKLEILWLPVA